MTNESWNKWDDRYDRDDYLFGTAPSAFLLKHQKLLTPNAKTLAVADGEGRNSVWLAQQGATVTAFDNSKRGLEKARSLTRQNSVNVDFRFGDIEAWNWDATQYDMVAAIFIQFAAPALRSAIFRGLNAALRPGGLLLLHGFAPRQVGYATGGPPHEANMYTLPMLRDAFAGYTILHDEDYDEVVDAGPGHNGKAALIDFVAQKPALTDDRPKAERFPTGP